MDGFRRVRPIGAALIALAVAISSVQGAPPTLRSESIEPEPATVKSEQPVQLPPIESAPSVPLVAVSDDQAPIESSSAGLPDERTPTEEASTTVRRSLQLDDVIESVLSTYPLIESAVLERVVASGNQVAALGEFDLKLKAESVTQELGFYRNYRNGAGIEQPLWNGGRFEAGHRFGHGDFEPWYKERETDEGGEYKFALYLPLIQNRRIDDRRGQLFKSQIDRSIVEPFIQQQAIEFIREASVAYWRWLAAGRVLSVNRRQLELALERRKAFEALLRVEKINRILFEDNERLVLARQAKVEESEQKLQNTAIKLSLFLRTADGRPMIADSIQVPGKFPDAVDRSSEPLAQDISVALSRRPELASLNLERRRLDVEYQLARNLYLPQVDSYLSVKDGVGGRTSSLGDKDPLTLEAGLAFSMPYQRRKGIGKMQAVRGKVSQLLQKIEFTENKITTEVQSAVNDLLRSFRRFELNRDQAEKAEMISQFVRDRLDVGQSGLLDLNIREDQAAAARITEIESLLDYYEAKSNLRAAMADDLERISALSLWCR